MKNPHRILIVAVTALIVNCALALPTLQADDQLQFYFDLEGSYLTGLDYSFNHTTHADDSFLGGPAGTTSLDDTFVGMIAGGLTYRFHPAFSFDLGGGWGIGDEEESRRHANETRPARSESRIYSELDNIIVAEAAVNYAATDRFTVGVLVRGMWLDIESGWDRFGSRQAESSTDETVILAGPRVSCALVEGVDLYGTYLFGDAQQIAIGLRLQF